MVLVSLGVLLLVTPQDGTDQGRECGGAPSAAAAVGVDTAAPGDGTWCRSEARDAVLGGVLLFLLPGAVLLWWQWWHRRGVEVVDAAPPPGSPNGVEPSGAGPPTDALPGASVSAGLVTGQLPDRLVLYRSSWWLLGIPGSTALAVFFLYMYLDPEGVPADGLLLIPVALWLLWRGLGAVRGRPLLVVDRDGITISQRPTLHATWDQVSAMEFRPAVQGSSNQLLVRLHEAPDGRTVTLDGLSAPPQEVADVAERLHARHREGTITDRSQTVGSRPSRLAAAAAVAVALIVAAVGWYRLPSTDLAAGDCYRETASSLQGIACDEPHDGEIFIVLDHPAADAAPWPGHDTLLSWAEDRCEPEFTSYVGRTVDSDDRLTYVVWTPYPQGWTQGDREILCAVVSESGERLTERAQGS
jgi:hypothetical protein